MRYKHLIGLPLVGILSVAQAQDEKAPALDQRIDLTSTLQSRSDQRSQAFNFGGQHIHRFEVEESGRYTLGAETLAAFEARYWFEATLRNAKGEALLSDKHYVNAEPWSERVELEPGQYELVVQASEHTDTARKGNRFVVTVSGEGLAQKTSTPPVLGRAGSGLEEAVGRLSSAFTQGVSTLTGSGKRGEAETRLDSENMNNEKAINSSDTEQKVALAPSTQGTSDAKGTSDSTKSSPAETFSRVVADVDVSYEGEALEFILQEPGRVRIYTTSLVGVEKNYKVEALLMDAQNGVVAREEGERFAGDIDMTVDLPPGRYTVWVNGHRYGSAHDGMQNYALNVERLD
ncbi:hypothetical protein [Vreelandella massiliensis]|uniref:hypothetical protein n=1 Tax=Vreelandella massiliensis TaxID=1816686 RepID=UPI00096A89A5|nr:hypothetical protein [Halomonas massiliensis]